MAVNFNFSIIDPTGAYSAYQSQVLAVASAAGQRWAQFLVGDASIEVAIQYVDVNGTAAGGSATTVAIGGNGELTVRQAGAAYEILTGVDPNGGQPDINITVHSSYLQNYWWFDPDPTTRTATIPSGKVDAESTLLHELGHALGFIGSRDWATGQLPSNYESAFDQYVIADGSNFYFNGPNAVGEYGAPVPLTAGLIYHYGNAGSGPGADLVMVSNLDFQSDILMNGAVNLTSKHRDISAIDIAMLKDTGLQFVANPPLHTVLGSTDNDVVKLTSLNDTINTGMGNDTVDGGRGIDTAIFSGNRALSTITKTASGYTVSGPEGTDALSNIERLQFSDQKLALDVNLGAGAGNTARIIGAAFDAPVIQQHPDYVGIGLQLFDSGMSMPQVCQLAIGAMGSPSNVAFVTTVYTNVVGVAPSAADRDLYVGLLQGSGGTMTQAQLLELAANADVNAVNINLVGLEQSGVGFV